MSGLLDKLRSSQGRIISGLTMMAALAVGLSPDSERSFSIEKATAIALATVVWLFSEIGSQGPSSASDVALYRRIKGLMNEAALSFLDQHDFGASLRDSQTYPVGEICSWHGADAEFLDSKVQKSWENCQSRFASLNRLYAQNLGPGSAPDRLSAIPPGTDDWNLPQHLHEAVAALNNGAAQAYLAFNEFDRIARKRLGL